jgi:hypothetical protein
VPVNKRGHPETLVPSQPGNANALKHGVHSPRLIQSRADEIASELMQSFVFSPALRLAVLEAARSMAILEAIDRDLDERGLVDKGGEPRYLLNHRARVSRQLAQWLQNISAVTERQSADAEEPPRAEFADYVRALQRIALGQDASGNARERLAALKELLKLEQRGTTSYIERASDDDPELHRRWAQVHRADSLSRLASLERNLGLDD